MKLSELRISLEAAKELHFRLPNGEAVPAHFHLTEIGLIDKTYVDCGGQKRQEQKASLQLWWSNDTEHRLEASKLAGIIDGASTLFGSLDPEVEVEYQMETIGKFGLGQGAHGYELIALQTDCLAKDNCGITPAPKQKLSMADLESNTTCTPGGGCC